MSRPVRHNQKELRAQYSAEELNRIVYGNYQELSPAEKAIRRAFRNNEYQRDSRKRSRANKDLALRYQVLKVLCRSLPRGILSPTHQALVIPTAARIAR